MGSMDSTEFQMRVTGPMGMVKLCIQLQWNGMFEVNASYDLMKILSLKNKIRHKLLFSSALDAVRILCSLPRPL